MIFEVLVRTTRGPIRLWRDRAAYRRCQLPRRAPPGLDV